MFRDSPLAHSDPSSETRISPPINAKCMMDRAVQVSPDYMDEGATSSGIKHDTLAAQELNHSFQIQHNPAGQPTPNRRSLENEEDIEHVEEIPLSSEVQAKPLDVTGKPSSNVTDKTDGTWLTEEDTTPDESCGIQCLYSTMQCCASMIL